MNEKKLLLFPFNDYSFPLIDYLKKSNVEFLLATCIGTGLVGKDAAYSVNMPNINVEVLDIHKICWNQISDLVLLNPGENLSLYNQIENILPVVKKNNIPIRDLTNRIDNKSDEKKDYKFTPIKPIQKPVVYVSGLFESIFNSLICLNLKLELKKLGINAKIITEDKNFRYTNDIIYDVCFLEKPEKLYWMQYKLYEQIKMMDDDNHVDLIVIQVPGGFAQVNDHVLNDFGVYFSFLNNIVRPDFFIVSLPYDFSDNEMIYEMRDVAENKYHKQIDTFVVNNGYWRFSEGVTLTSQPKDVYLPFELLKESTKEKVYVGNYKLIAEDILEKLGDE